MSTLIKQSDRYIFQCAYGEHLVAKEAKFRWDPAKRCWWTDDDLKAVKLAGYAAPELAKQLRAQTKERIEKKEAAVQASKALDSSITIPHPEGIHSSSRRYGLFSISESWYSFSIT